MNELYDFAAVFVHSDVAAQSPAWWHWINAQSSHALLSAFFATVAPRWWSIFFVGWIAKEGFGDIPNGDFAGLVILDSMVDLVAGYLGGQFILLRERESLRQRHWLQRLKHRVVTPDQ